MTEHWLPVVGWKGLYDVSDHGNVRSLPRQTARGIRGGILLKRYIAKSGYPMVGLSRSNQEKNRLVHHLVLEAFTGPRPEGHEARHGPGGKTDASLANLCWGTRLENVGPDRVRDGQDNRGERNGQAKLTWEAVHDIRRRVAAGEIQRSVARHYGVTFQHINMVITGNT